ncbi:MAG: N-6 DNA methylase [Chitinophagaceae bacterium]|nr:N-6 DNA methylase [Chitinophagaceae bacterium]
MTLHEAILHVLNSNPGGLSLDQIVDQINEQRLYEKKDRTAVTASQIKIRIHNYSNLFRVENGAIHLHSDFEKQAYVFNHILHDVIASTSNYSIKDRQKAIPLLFFIKRIVEAQMGSYGIKVDVPFREYYEEFEEDVPTDSAKTYLAGLIKGVDELFNSDHQLEPIRPMVLNFLRGSNAELLKEIHTVLLRYSFDSNKYSNREFGYFFNSLIERLAKASGNYQNFTTPDAINKIITNLYSDNNFSLLDPFAGAGGSLVNRNDKYASRMVIGYEKSQELWTIGILNLILNGIDTIDFYNGDVLSVSGLFKKKAELIITDIPFDSRVNKGVYDFLHWAETSDATGVYLQYILDSLEMGGKAVVVVPSAFLFNNSSSIRKLKEAILDNNWLDAVIALPAGLLKPYSGVACAVLCFDLSRSIDQDILFIDASEISKPDGRERYIHDDDTDVIVQLFNERPKTFEQGKLSAGMLSTEVIKDDGFDWTPKRHLYQLSNQKQIDLFGSILSNDVIELGEVLQKISSPKKDDEVFDLKVIKGKDLKPGIIDFKLREADIAETVSTTTSYSGLLKSNALLILTHFKSHKPTYFVYEGKAVLVSNNVKAFAIDETKVLPEYLISQFHVSYFTEQLDAIRIGNSSTQSFFSIKDFLKLRIKLPPLHEQKTLYEEARNKALTEKAEAADELTKELVRQRTAAITEQIAIISSIQHELGNKLPALKNSLDDLKDYFHANAATKNGFSIQSKIRPVLPGENPEEVDSIEDLFKRVENILTYTITMVDDAGGIINSDPSRFKPQKTELANYLRQEVEMYKQVHRINGTIQFEFLVEDGVFLWLDKKQFSKALSNIINNAIKHGFADAARVCHIIFQLIPDDEYHILLIKNDGLPFPEGFTIEQYKKAYHYAGNSGTSGVGGYIIGKVLENHKAEILLRDKIDIADPYKVQFEIRFPKQ